MRTARTRFIKLVGVVAVGILAVAGCSKSNPPASSNNNTNTTASSEKITLKIGLFGTFGYKEAGLYDKYMADHPNIKIVEDDTEQEQVYYQALTTHLAASSGLDDIQGIEVGRIADVVQNQAGKWVDLSTLGANDEKSNFFPWKWQAASTKDGQVLGLGTDIGPQAICYRTDLFKAAGLTTDRTKLGQMWSDWNGFINVGKQYKAHAPKGSSFTDTASGTYNAIIGQSQEQYYDANGNLVYETNPAVKNAWNLAMQLATGGLTARLKQFDTPWNAGFASGSFATVACPAWMMGYIKGQSKNGSGKWDVAPLPGQAGNWGGSYLGIPKASQHQKEAYDLAKWLTSAEQQVTMFTKVGNFPSNSTAANDPKVQSATDAYFSNAPIGQIFSSSAQKMPVAFIGPNDGKIKDAFSNGIVSVEQQNKSPDDAWAASVKNIKDAIGN